jgi:hypothetical protein
MPITLDHAFYGFQLSENMSKTPEGFLCCLNVKIARTGIQYYEGGQIGKPHLMGQRVKVYRLAEDVFHPDAMRSFEGKPLTDDHPAGGWVDLSNYHIFSKGHFQNVRQDGEYLIGDFIFSDGNLQKKVEVGQKREVSAGYTCDFEPYEDGFRQVNIRGNHVAVVSKGRAGPKVTITDSVNNGVKRPMTFTEVHAKALRALASDPNASDKDIATFATGLVVNDQDDKDKTPVAAMNDIGLIAKIFQAMQPAKRVRDEDDDKDEKKEDKKVEDSELKELRAIVDDLAKTVKSLVTKDEDDDDDKKEDKKVEDGASAFFKALGLDEDDDKDDKKEKVEDSLPAFLESMKPALAKMSKSEQKVVKDALTAGFAGVKRGDASASFAKISKAVSDQQKVRDGETKVIDWKAKSKEQWEKYSAQSKKQ